MPIEPVGIHRRSSLAMGTLRGRCGGMGPRTGRAIHAASMGEATAHADDRASPGSRPITTMGREARSKMCSEGGRLADSLGMRSVLSWTDC